MPRVGSRALFRDRRDAGRRLAERLDYLKAEQPVVLGLPRGGVPLAYEAAGALRCPHQFEVVPHASHLFEEPGALERVAQLATGWFSDHLAIKGGHDAAAVT